jgi:acyl-CoA thioester hydrolase
MSTHLSDKYSSGFRVKLQLRLDWSEMDLFGHINNVMFMKYIQAARVNYWEKIKLNALYEKQRIGPMLVSVNCQFRKPLHYPGQVTIFTKIDFIKNSSFALQHLLLDKENELVAEAHDVMVMYDFNTGQKVAFPEELKKNIGLVEENEPTSSDQY